jgi:hypothetical protein
LRAAFDSDASEDRGGKEETIPGSIDVITGDHSHSDTGLLALFNGIGNLGPHRILNTNDTQAGEIGDDVLLVLPIGLVVNVNLIDVGLAWYKVPVSDRDRPEAIACHRLDHILHQPVLHVPRELLQVTIATINKGTSAIFIVKRFVYLRLQLRWMRAA